jgi:flagellar operon protein (TIGR03826 family)
MANIRDICQNCIKDIEHQYELCVQYLREERRATIQELSDATEVSIKQITRFIREGRISVLDAPNLMYPCEVCGTLIREGHMCDSCRTRLTKELTESIKGKENKEFSTRETGEVTYRAIDKFHK